LPDLIPNAGRALALLSHDAHGMRLPPAAVRGHCRIQPDELDLNFDTMSLDVGQMIIQ
jgi:hypothetical protein